MINSGDILYYQWGVAGLALLSLALIVLAARIYRVRRQREKKLQAERDEWGAYFMSSPAGTVVLDKNRVVMRLNSAAASLVACDTTHLGVQKFGKVFECANNTQDMRGCGYSGQCVICPIFTAVASVIADGKEVRGIEMPIVLGRTGETHTIWLRVCGKPVDIAGVRCVIVTLDDISKEKSSQETQQQAAAEQERMNDETNKASETKGQFLANMSHEIRTPLNGVIGMTGLLMNTNLDEEQREYAQTIQTSAKILLVVVNDVLDFSKIEANKLILEKSSFDLQQCVEEAIRVVAPNVGKKKLEIICQIDKALQTYWIGDAGRISQILVNLLGNAIKFTERGEVVVSVTGKPLGGRRFQLDFAVQDTGVGIPPKDQEKLFQSFSQVDTTATRKFGGTGLGLAISKRLCELMGGSMSVESTGVAGKGSTFKFSIIVQSDAKPQSGSGAEPERVLAGKRVLIVEDHAISRETLSEQILRWEMVPVTAISGTAAVGILHGRQPLDVALIDSEMTDTSGMDLAEVIRSLPNRSGMQVILLSPLGGQVKEAARRYVDVCLTKPVLAAQLHASLVIATTARPAQTFTPASPPPAVKRVTGDMGQQYPFRILLAEDNLVNQKVAVSTLNKLGYQVDVVGDGLQALETVKKQVYDIIFMDVQMPEMDGEMATTLIRKEVPAERQPWIIALTAHALPGDRERYLAGGMNDYLSKPVRVERLVEVLKAAKPVTLK